MSRNAYQEMDSYRLAQYVVQAPCYVCGGGNVFDAEYCRHCSAPMALSHQANTQKVRPQMVAAIGPAGAGKTVYLGVLSDVLSRQNDRMQILARGAFSISLQQTTLGALGRCRFPEKTPNEPDRWNWLHCQVKMQRRRPVELIMPDMAGEALLQELDHPNTYPIINSFLRRCAGVMLMVDAPDLEHGDDSHDYFAMKIVSYLCELEGHPRKGWPNRPVSLIFTKADQCAPSSFDAPADFARQHAPGLYRTCQERLRKHAFFATGVAGCCAFRNTIAGKMQVPLRIEPRGIVDPFEWLVGQIQ
jgi:hypothetical protein